MVTERDPVDPAILLGRLFERLGVPYCVGGSIASSFQGEVRTTLDVDLKVQAGALDRAYLERAARDLGLRALLDRALAEAGLQARRLALGPFSAVVVRRLLKPRRAGRRKRFV